MDSVSTRIPSAGSNVNTRSLRLTGFGMTGDSARVEGSVCAGKPGTATTGLAVESDEPSGLTQRFGCGGVRGESIQRFLPHPG